MRSLPVRGTTLLLSLGVGCLAAASCSNDKGSASASASPGVHCDKASAASATRTFVGPHGFTPACVTTKRGVDFVIGNVDDTSHTVTSDKAAPQAINVTLPHKNSLFSVKLAQPGTYHLSASGGATVTIFVT